MKCSLQKNLPRYFLTLGLFAFLGTLFIFSLKENTENGKEKGVQSVADKENSFKYSQFLGTRKDTDENANTFDNRNLNGFEPPGLNKRAGWAREEIVSDGADTGHSDGADTGHSDGADTTHQRLPLDVYIFEEHHEGQFFRSFSHTFFFRSLIHPFIHPFFVLYFLFQTVFI